MFAVVTFCGKQMTIRQVTLNMQAMPVGRKVQNEDTGVAKASFGKQL